MLADQALAKGVDRLNAGRTQQSQLTAQMGVGGVFRQKATQSVAHALTHFPCRRVGKGHHQQFIHPAGVFFVGEQAQHSAHQNGGFARAGGSRNDEAGIPAIDSQLLLFGQLDLHACTSSVCSSSSCKISWTLAGLSTGKNRSLSFFRVGSKWQASRKSQKRQGLSSRPVR